MRGETQDQKSLVMLMNPEDMVPKGHPIRRVKQLADGALKELSPVFDAMYADKGRASVPPEVLLKASLLMALYSVRSERMLCEQLQYNLMFRWFLDLDMVGEVFDHSTFSKNRQRLLDHDVAGEFFRVVVSQAQAAQLMSAEHFTVDGTLIEAWASLKSFVPKDDAEARKARNRRKSERRKQRGKGGKGGGGGSNVSVDFHGETRSNETHESSTDPEAKLYRKSNGTTAKLCYAGHALMENRNGLLVDLRVSEADGTAERELALEMLIENKHRRQRCTVGADKAYDTRSFVETCRDHGITPHVACNDTNRRSAIDGRTTHHAGYSRSQRLRKRVEEIFGWAKTYGGLRKTRFKGRLRTQLGAYLIGAAYNLMRMAKLQPVAGLLRA